VGDREPKQPVNLEVGNAAVQPGELAVNRRPHEIASGNPVGLREGGWIDTEVLDQLVLQTSRDVVGIKKPPNLPSDAVREMVGVRNFSTDAFGESVER